MFYFCFGFKISCHISVTWGIREFICYSFFVLHICPDVVNPAHLFSSRCQNLYISFISKRETWTNPQISSAVIYFLIATAWITFRATSLDWGLTNRATETVRLSARLLLSPNLAFWRETYSSKSLRPRRCVNTWICGIFFFFLPHAVIPGPQYLPHGHVFFITFFER